LPHAVEFPIRTLADLLGGDVARMSFEPKLRDARKRWGGPAFDEIKKAYEAHRKNATPGVAS
jgi:hypothetical protein